VLALANPAWQLPVGLASTLTVGGSIIFCYLFPSGRFVPSWARRVSVGLLISLVALAIVSTQFPNALPQACEDPAMVLCKSNQLRT
jgi:hypothetical protein